MSSPRYLRWMTPFVVLILLASLFPTVSVHAQSPGLVCMGGVNPPPPCPTSPPTFTQSFPGGNDVLFVQNSQPFNGFDISVKVDPTILNATGFDVNFASEAFVAAGGTLFIAAECINNHPVMGNCRSQDGPGIASIAVTSNVLVTAGHLYNISYSAIGTGTTSVGYQTGCTGTSLNNTCVTLVNAGTIDPENVQGATFSTATSDFSITVAPTSQTITAGSSASYTVTISSINGFAGTVNLGTAVSPVVSQGPASTLDPSSVTLTSGSTATSTLTVSTSSSTPAGTYTITVTGTSGALSHSTPASLTVNLPADFSLSANPTSESVRRGSTATYTITITSLNGFAGTISLTATITPALGKGPTAAFSPMSVAIISGGAASSTLTVATARSTSQGSYAITVTGASGATTHSTTVTLTVTK